MSQEGPRVAPAGAGGVEENGATGPLPGEGDGSIVQCGATESFVAWLQQINGSLIITTYQAGKVAMVGWRGDQISLLMRDFRKPMGLAVQGSRIALATRDQVWIFANAPLLAPEYLEDQPGRYDALYLPRLSYYTNDLNIHDLAFGRDGLWVVNTRFSCLARLSADYNFEPVWNPPFITEVAPEDRCHLNGLAMLDGRPKYMTALGETDVVGGWRPNKADGGIILDVESGQILVRGLSMPHCPRWYDGRLWFLNSGTGELCIADLARGQRTPVCMLPGYLRGLGFVGPFALVGMSKIRERHIFGGLPLQQSGIELKCGVAVVDVRSGQMVGFFEFTAGCTELYEVQLLPGTRRPMILNLDRDVVQEAVTAPQFSYWLRPSKMIPPDDASPAAPPSVRTARGTP